MVVAVRTMYKSVCYLIAGIIAVATSLPHPRSGNVGGFEYFHSGEIYLLSNVEETAYGAQLYCERYGGNLAVINETNKHFLDFSAAVAGESDFWIGAMTQQALAAIPPLRRSINCTGDAGLCQNDVSFPHVNITAASSSCFQSLTCAQGAGSALVDIYGINLVYTNWLPNYTPNTATKQCVVAAFRLCDQIGGCNISYWGLGDCRMTRKFICQKKSCPLDPIPLPAAIFGASFEDDYLKFVGAQIHCGAYYVRASFNYCAKRYLQLQEIRLGASRDNCSESRSQLVVGRVSTCGAVASTNETNVQYTYTLYSQIGRESSYGLSSRIQRQRTLTANLKCSYRKEQLVSLPQTQYVNTSRDEIITNIQDVVASFRTLVEFFTDATYTNVINTTERPFTIPQDIYVQISLPGIKRDDYVLMATYVELFRPEDCSCDFYVLLDFDGSTEPTLQFHENANSTVVRFKFKSFLWISAPISNMVMFAELTTCDRSIPPGCSAQPGRKRRNAESNLTKQKIKVPISFGEADKESACYKGNHQCDQICRPTYDQHSFECLCQKGYYLDQDMHSCIVADKSITKGKKNDQSMVKSEPTVYSEHDTDSKFLNLKHIFLLSVLMLCVAFLISCSRKGSFSSTNYNKV